MDAAFEKLAAQEQEFLQSEFLAPVVKGQPICVRIAGVIMEMAVKPKNFEGWGVFRPQDYKNARFRRVPNLQEKSRYLQLLPKIRLILTRRDENNQWFGISAVPDGSKIKVTGLAPVIFVEEVQLFDVVQARYNGGRLWFECADGKANPRIAAYLRESLTNEIVPEKLEFSGMTKEDRDAYFIAFNDLVSSRKNKEEERIKSALQRAGGQYVSYLERSDSYTVEYEVNGARHRSVVDKQSLSVQSAGICLSGGDRAFDLQSLVSVIREGQNRHLIHHVGGYQDYDEEEEYD